jgi:hypothetical protein
VQGWSNSEGWPIVGIWTRESKVQPLQRPLRPNSKHCIYLLRRSAQAVDFDWLMAPSIRTSSVFRRDLTFDRIRPYLHSHSTDPLFADFDIPYIRSRREIWLQQANT